MIQVSYLSRATAPMSPEQLLSLLLQSRRNNAARGITGMLLYGNETFLQVIEGEDAAVDALVERIGADSRHAGVKILARKAVAARQYSDWSMSFERVTPRALEEVEGLHNFGAEDFTFETLARDETAVEALMDHFRAPHWDPLVRELDAKDKLIAHLRKGLLQAKGRTEVATLVIESLIEASRKGPLGEEHLRLAESALGQARGD
jgi:Sensors of blue-light using FAD